MNLVNFHSLRIEYWLGILSLTASTLAKLFVYRAILMLLLGETDMQLKEL